MDKIEVLTLSREDVENLITIQGAFGSVELAFRAGKEGGLVQPQKKPMYIDFVILI